MKSLRTIFLLGIFTLLAFADSTEIKRPTADSDPGSSALSAWANTNCGIGNYAANSISGTLARDAAGQTTSIDTMVNALISPASKRNVTVVRLYKAWDTTANSYSALTLNVVASSNGPDISGKVCIVYSTNMGLTWTAIRCDTGAYGQATSTVSLSPTLLLSNLQVGICVRSQATATDSGINDLRLYDIWTSGTLGVAGNGNGSGVGDGGRSAVQIN